MKYSIIIFTSILMITGITLAGNEKIADFSSAKNLMNRVYADHRITFYCLAEFDAKGKIELPDGFYAPKYVKRSYRKEWEHIVPAENFGRTFPEWREGDPECINKKGKPFKGRKCAQTNPEFARIEADMYNLVPAIGSVNAIRSNYNFRELPDDLPNTFGTCPMIIDGKKVEPPSYTKGFIARTYFYMEQEYPRFKISKQMKQMFIVWDKEYPVDEWECERARRIEKFQGNMNKVVNERCQEAGH